MSRLRAYAQLVRLPALPTALADIGLGALATGALAAGALSGRWAVTGFLVLSTASLYSGGMVLNDTFDLEQDRRERPERPLPSGKITRRAAGWLGAGLLAAGLFFATGADLARPGGDEGRHWLSAGLALTLGAAILLYDGWLKRTAAGPVAMGACRFLNVLLGVSVSGTVAWPVGPHLAAVVALYITGVTWLARTEAGTSRRADVVGAAAVIGAAFVLALPVPYHRPPGAGSWLFTYLLVLLGFAVAGPIRRALDRPQPGPVQAAVRRCLLCLIVLDAVLATGLAGMVGLVLLILLAPALYLSGRRWLYAT